MRHPRMTSREEPRSFQAPGCRCNRTNTVQPADSADIIVIRSNLFSTTGRRRAVSHLLASIPLTSLSHRLVLLEETGYPNIGQERLNTPRIMRPICAPPTGSSRLGRVGDEISRTRRQSARLGVRPLLPLPSSPYAQWLSNVSLVEVCSSAKPCSPGELQRVRALATPARRWRMGVCEGRICGAGVSSSARVNAHMPLFLPW